MKDLTGKRFYKLVVIKFSGWKIEKTRRRPAWLCLCDCGNKIKTVDDRLKRGGVKTCGCSRITHGETIKIHRSTPEYICWQQMKLRTTNKNHRAFKHYGGRGIRVCRHWSGKNGFVNFLEDMGRKPSPKHTLERKNNNGNYRPKNCRWATRKEQANNRRKNHLIKSCGKTKTLEQWSEITKIPRTTILDRLNRGIDSKTALELK